ncbi:MAG: LytTR family transcriptional regulator [Bacteroidales bacterium]|nr:LytTR family transcriptional regulator [Bacteroidales bacterium]MCL2132776.1 LytTR family transcriptional regulator [Bacteroidales bacterium]
MRNPLFRNYQAAMLYGVCVVVMITIQTLVVHYIYGLAIGYACLDAAVFNLSFAFFLLFLWYPVYFNRKSATLWYSFITNNILIAALFLLFSIGVGYLLLQWLMETDSVYMHFLNSSISWKILEGILVYIIGLLAYYLLMYIEKLNESAEKRRSAESLSRIAVKDRQEIHLIPVQEIHFLEADGDYVKLHSSEGTFLKEKTMKYFEENLPQQQFVRIHRSYIVNVDYVAKIALYEKEKFHIHLKNNTILKASLKGYRALKEVVRL